jgi:hypothetical protein
MQMWFILLLMAVLSPMIVVIVLIACVNYERLPGTSEGFFP